MNHEHSGDAVASTATAEAVKPTPAHTLTYRALLERHVTTLSKSQASQARTYLNHWLRLLKRTLDHPIGNELTSEFDRYFATFSNRFDNEGRAGQTTWIARSTLRSFRRSHIAWLTDSDLPPAFTDALRMATARAGYTLKGLMREYKARHNLHVAQLTKWLSGKASPDYKRTRERSRVVIQRLEVILNVPRDALVVRAFASAPRLLLEPLTTRIPFRELHSLLVNDPHFRYGIRELPPQLQAAFAALTEWRQKDKHYLDGKYIGVEAKKRWNSDKTVQLYRHDWESFFGFLCLPTKPEIPAELPEQLGATPAERAKRMRIMTTGMGMRPEDLRITMLVDHTLLARYIEFRKARNIHEGTTDSVVSTIVRYCSLLANKDHAFLRRHIAYGKGLKPAITSEKKWQAWCDARYVEMRSLINSLSKTKLKLRSRNPDEPMKHVFAQDEPADVLINLGKHLLNTLPARSGGVTRAVQYRNATVLLLMVFEPLRAGHWVRLRVGKHIYKEPSTGKWVLDVKAEEFKNFIWGYAEDRYRVLPDDLAEVVERYITEYRIALRNAAETDFFVVKHAVGAAAKSLNPQMTDQGFYSLVSDVLRDYLGMAVGAHIFRHIVVTDYLGKHQGDYETGAAILNDSPATVRAAYNKNTQKDLLKRRDADFNGRFKGVGKR